MSVVDNTPECKRNWKYVLVWFAIIFGAAYLAHGMNVEIKDQVGPEGPWYTEEFLKENPQYRTDMYYCSEYYKNQQTNK